MDIARSVMDIARSVAALLTWQWLILFLALTFRQALRRLFDRLVGFTVGGEKGIQFSAPFRDDLEIETGTVREIGTPNILPRIDAKLIVLRDSEGRERATLGVTDKDAVSFTLSGSDGLRRVHLQTFGDNSLLSFINPRKAEASISMMGGPKYSALHLHSSTEALVSLWTRDDKASLIVSGKETRVINSDARPSNH
jgi:hypothetical protein